MICAVQGKRGHMSVYHWTVPLTLVCILLCVVQGESSCKTVPLDYVFDACVMPGVYSTGKEKPYDCALNTFANVTTWKPFRS